jgi:hypothetical protein
VVQPPITDLGADPIRHDILRVAFSPDGSMLAAKNFGREGMVRVWALDIDDLLAIAHQKVTRSLTEDESRQYLHVDACPATAS